MKSNEKTLSQGRKIIFPNFPLIPLNSKALIWRPAVLPIALPQFSELQNENISSLSLSGFQKKMPGLC